MWLNHLKVGLRSLFKNKFITSINLAGLGLGMLASLLVLIFIKSELSYDRWIPAQEQVYRLYRAYGNNQGNLTSPAPMAAVLRAEASGLESATRLVSNTDMLLEYEQEFYKVPEMLSIDQHFLECIPLPLVQGNPQNALNKPQSALLSQQMAQRIFGATSPIGEQLLLENSSYITVTGVLAAFSGPSHLKADLFLYEPDDRPGSWTGGRGQVYVKLQPNTNPDQISQTASRIYNEQIKKDYQQNQQKYDASKMPQWSMQALSKVHLNSQELGETGAFRGSFKQITIIGALGFLILLLAIINYVNLATAQLNKKSTEIGVRRVIGASQKNLINQFVASSLIQVALSLALALMLIPYVLPYFNEMVSRDLIPQDLFNPSGLFLLGVLVLVIAFLTGVFPALYYSRLNPVDSIRGKKQQKNQHQLRNALVVVQFTLSIGTLLFVSLVNQQLGFMLEKDLGFAGDQVAVFRINQSETADQFQQKKNRLTTVKGVQSISQISRPPGAFIPNYQFKIGPSDETESINVLFADEDLAETLSLELLNGRYFDSKFKNDDQESFVVNEAFVRKYGLEQALDYKLKFSRDSVPGRVIGVIKDFHYKSMEFAIEPLVISSRLDKAWMGRVAIRLDGSALSAALPALQALWQEMEPGFPTTQYFLSERFEGLYQKHLQFKRSLSYTAFIGTLIALLGLLGLTLFVTQQRTKEIGIRKVLGASVVNIVTLLSRDLLKLVGYGMLISLPISWYLLQRWLDNFAYQASVSWINISLIIVATLMLAWLTMSLQSIRVALANPVDSLADE
jgi:putative ABC transport system permease protein